MRKQILVDKLGKLKKKNETKQFKKKQWNMEKYLLIASKFIRII